MYEPIIVYKTWTTTVILDMGFDCSTDQFYSDIRDQNGDLIASWGFSAETDGTDGRFLMTIDNSVSSVDPVLTATKGSMDIKRVTGGEPVPAINGKLDVFFREVDTP